MAPLCPDLSYLSRLVNGESDAAGRENDDSGCVVVVLVAEPEENGEYLKDVKRVEYLFHQQIRNRVKRNKNVVWAINQSSEMKIKRKKFINHKNKALNWISEKSKPCFKNCHNSGIILFKKCIS